MRNVLANWSDLSRKQVERTRDCLVTGYQALIETVTLPDADDRHVLAAAIYARAETVATFNRKDFSAAALAPYDIEAQHSDKFVSGLLDAAEAVIVEAARRQRAALKNPPKSVEELLDTLEAQGLTQSVARLRRLSEQL
jgi:hypothetical protein